MHIIHVVFNNNNNNDLQKLFKGTGRVGNQKTNRDHPNYCVVKIG